MRGLVSVMIRHIICDSCSEPAAVVGADLGTDAAMERLAHVTQCWSCMSHGRVDVSEDGEACELVFRTIDEKELADAIGLADTLLDAADIRLAVEVRDQARAELARQSGWTFRGGNAVATGEFTTLSDAEARGCAFGALSYGPAREHANGC
jgi:hypothetical protein